MSPELLDLHIKKAKASFDGAIGVNIPLLRHDADALAEVTVSNDIRVVFTSAGNPGKFTDYFHNHNAIVAHVVPSLKLGLKAVARGVDVIVGEGVEAGGHNGFEEISTLPLVRRLVETLDVPVLAAGGIHDGAGLAAMLALGADGVQIGTRYACTTESSASDVYKRLIIESSEPATVLTNRKISPTRMLRGMVSEQLAKFEGGCFSREEIETYLGRGRAQKGLFEGDSETGYMEAGEVAGDICKVISANEVTVEMIEGYFATLAKMPGVKKF